MHIITATEHKVQFHVYRSAFEWVIWPALSYMIYGKEHLLSLTWLNGGVTVAWRR